MWLLAQVAEDTAGGTAFSWQEFINAFSPIAVLIAGLVGAAIPVYKRARKFAQDLMEVSSKAGTGGASEEELKGFKDGLKELREGLQTVEDITRQHDKNQRANIELTTERLNGVDRQVMALRETVDTRANAIDRRIENLDGRMDDVEQKQIVILRAIQDGEEEVA